MVSSVFNFYKLRTWVYIKGFRNDALSNKRKQANTPTTSASHLIFWFSSSEKSSPSRWTVAMEICTITNVDRSINIALSPSHLWFLLVILSKWDLLYFTTFNFCDTYKSTHSMQLELRWNFRKDLENRLIIMLISVFPMEVPGAKCG
jgi:hypothetical protein